MLVVPVSYSFQYFWNDEQHEPQDASSTGRGYIVLGTVNVSQLLGGGNGHQGGVHCVCGQGASFILQYSDHNHKKNHNPPGTRRTIEVPRPG